MNYLAYESLEAGQIPVAHSMLGLVQLIHVPLLVPEYHHLVQL